VTGPVLLSDDVEGATPKSLVDVGSVCLPQLVALVQVLIAGPAGG
jgi:hypothetical protein